MLQGLLRPLLDTVNMVNAPVIARERNIDISEVKNDREGTYHTLIRLTVVTADRRRSAQFEHTLLVTETGAEILTLP